MLLAASFWLGILTDTEDGAAVIFWQSNKGHDGDSGSDETMAGVSLLETLLCVRVGGQ